MKPIMKAHVMVVEEITRWSLSLFEHSLPGEWKNEKKKPDRTTTPTFPPKTHLKPVSLRMFRRCFQFKFNIRFVQFRKIICESS